MRSLSLRSGNSPTTPYGGRVNGVGSRTGAPPVGSSESGPTGHVSSPRLVKRSMRISRRFPACFASRVMWPFASGALSHSSRVLLHLFQPCPQCFRWVQPSPSRISSVSGPAVHRRLYHLASASLVAKVITDSGAASLHRRYPASLVLPTPPPPSRLSADFPVLPVIRPTFAPPISRRGEEGFSSCLARPRHRAVATTPPECRSASASLRFVILLSSSEGGLSLRALMSRGHLCVHSGDSPTTLTVTCRWASVSFLSLCHPSYGVLALSPAGLSPAERASLCWTHLQSIGFPPPCHPNYRALAPTPAGLSPAERASLCWTHKSLIRFSWLPRPCAMRSTAVLLRFELLTTIQ